MRDFIREKVETDLQVNANINGTLFTVAGKGYGVPGSGEVSVSVQTQDTLPKGFHLPLLSYVLITGQADISRPVENVENLFLETSGVYHATRTLNLGKMGELTTEYLVEPTTNGKRKSVFNIKGEVNTPPLVSVEPTFETWMPNGQGNIAGHFTMVWRTQDGTFVKGEAESQYFIPTEKSMTEVQYRHIEFEISCSENSLTQSEKILLFSPTSMESPVLRLAAGRH